MKVLFKNNNTEIIAEVPGTTRSINYRLFYDEGVVVEIINQDNDYYIIGMATSPAVDCCTILDDPNDILKEIL